MNIILGDLINRKDSLSKLVDKSFPAKASYKLRLTLKEIDKFLVTFEEQRNELIKKYGEQKSEGIYEVRRDSENWVKYFSDLNEIMAQSITVNIPEMDIDMFLVDSVDLSVKDIDALEFICKKEET